MQFDSVMTNFSPTRGVCLCQWRGWEGGYEKGGQAWQFPSFAAGFSLPCSNFSIRTRQINGMRINNLKVMLLLFVVVVFHLFLCLTLEMQFAISFQFMAPLCQPFSPSPVFFSACAFHLSFQSSFLAVFPAFGQ